MVRLSRSIIRKIGKSLRNLWDLWSNFQSHEDERWRNSVGGLSASLKDNRAASACERTTEAPARIEGQQEHPFGTARTSAKYVPDHEHESANGSIPTLGELVARRQSEHSHRASRRQSNEK